MSNDDIRRVPKQARSIEKKRRIIDAAITLFGEKGFQGTNAKEVAKQAGVSVGTFYAYFKDKKTVLMEILGEHMADVDQSIFSELEASIRQGASGREIMRAVVDLGDQTHRQPPALLRTLFAMRYTDEDIARFSRGQDDAMVAKLVSLFKTMEDRLRITDLEAAARIVANAFEETMHSVALSECDLEKKRLYDALVDMAAIYLFTDPDSRSR